MRRKLIIAAAALAGFIICINLLLLIFPFKELSSFEAKPVSQIFTDDTGRLLQITALEDGTRCEYTRAKDLPKAAKKIFIKAEDKRFYFHDGVDLFALTSAALQNLSNKGIVRGGSTITMQLVKMIKQDSTPSVGRKLSDIFYAKVLEVRKSKAYILELYLNNIFFGHGAVGIGSAARTYYGCTVQELTSEQLCCLAVIPRNPSLYDPFKNPELCAERACSLYNKIFHKKFTVQDFSRHLPSRLFSYPYEAPHYIRYLTQSKTGLANPKNKADNVHTLSINLELQQYAERLVNDGLTQAIGSRISNASLLLIENKTGTPLAWVGSADFFDSEHNGQIDGVLVNNQPGSSMKPFLYALALETKNDAGASLYTPNSILADIPQEFGGQKLYIPSNFNNRYNGPVRFRVALASSLNVPAVSILDSVGVPAYLEKLYELGFESLRQTGQEADLGLALGAAGVPLKELVPAFAVFARDGKDFDGNQIYQSDTARLIDDFLSDKAARVTGFGYSQVFETDYPSIFKTGTSNQYQNIIALGATKEYTIGVWMGNFSGQTVVGKTGSSLPAWIAKSLLDYIYGSTTSYSYLAFDEPQNWKKEKICSLSGMIAGPDCPATVYEYCQENNTPGKCTWHKKEDGELKTLYPAEYQQWARKTRPEVQIEYNNSPLYIQSPKDNSVFYYSDLQKEKLAISVEVFGGQEDELTVYYDELFYSQTQRPFSFQLPVERGTHSCTVVCGQEVGTVTFQVR
ncbi:MAG: transglycosylase domain-containing protein [Treponema sp.]|nr:transglycosylase domain-containing protein [Treponema sp.]